MPPVVSLRRGALDVRLHDSLARVFGASAHDAVDEHAVDFRRAEDAEAYLRHWAGEPGSLAMLRTVLARRDPGAASATFSNDRMLRALATQIATGALVVTEARIDLPRVAGESAVKADAAAAAPAASIPVSPVTPPAAPEVPALAALETVQIEGAQVLPEVTQTLEQIDASMANINLATVSLEPAPSGIPAIGAAMTDAGGSVTSTLDGL